MTVHNRWMSLLALALAAAPAATRAQQAPAQQAAALTPHQELAREIYAELIAINTVDGEGDNTAAAEAMAKRFREAGFPASDVQVLVPAPRKGNLVVRYRGRGARKPILLLAHLDVVAAKQSDWSPDIEPFRLTEREGYFYGRGTSDDKAMAALFVANLLRMKREGYAPDRDIILALTADEEGGPANGVQWLIANHRALIDAELTINEGGGGALKDGKPFINSVGAAEKVYHDFTLTARNRGGHSSVPRPDNAIYSLAGALERIGRYRMPVQLNAVTRAFFEGTAAIETREMADAMRALVRDPSNENAVRIVSRDPRYNAMLRTTCVATMLSGGHAPNALPQTATANVNCRMLPGHDPADVRARLIAAIADTGIEVSPAPEMERASPSALTPELTNAIQTVTRQLWGNVPVIPTMGTGATDSKYLRAIGIPSYGTSGIFTDPADARAHGRDERIPVKAFYEAQEYLDRLVKLLAPGKSAT